MGATYFFRDYHTLKMIPLRIIPYILEMEARCEGKINIWSAGCANGSEPYSVALILKEFLDEDVFGMVNIYATDIDPNCKFSGIISGGSYPHEALKKVPEEIFQKNFSEDPGVPGNYVISGDVRERVMYMWHDLNSLVPPLNEHFEIIICKNVLLHFQKQNSLKIMRMFYDSLAEDGFLITEQTQKIPPEITHGFSQFVDSAQIHRKIDNDLDKIQV